MKDTEFDALIARAGDPNLIPGIYNYCDRRCDRCRFATRCFDHLESLRRPEPDPGETVVDSVCKSMERTLGMLQIIARRKGFDLSETPEQMAEQERQSEARWERAMADQAVVLSKQYAMTAWPITRALWPVIMPRGDTKVIDALETIEVLSSLVSSKTFRAVHGMLEEDFDPTDIQGDANGSAKIARLLVAESRGAWRVLMEAGRATADGVPAKLVGVLEELDAALASRFPRAMDFVRPGFDDDSRPAPGTSEDVVALTAMPR